MRGTVLDREGTISIIIPTYNESQNITGILKSIGEHVPKNMKFEAIVVDDNSPDGTALLAEDYFRTLKEKTKYTINVIKRKTKDGLSSAILNGIQNASGDTIVVMDSDFSHPPQLIPRLIETLKKYQCDIAVASRYVKGGSVENWPIKRKIISKVATLIAKKGLGVKTNDPMSGFFAFRKNIIDGLNFDGIGYKILLEMLVKARGAAVHEIPYTFTDRKFGKSKLGTSTIFDYSRAVWKLYLYGKNSPTKEGRKSVKFVSKAARFFTVGASGLGVNFITSLAFASQSGGLWYLHANLIGIIFSMMSNFVLNKIWTFEDSDFSTKKTLSQLVRFVSFSSLGAVLQLGMVYYLMEHQALSYPVSLVLAVGVAAFGNFILNKKWTFRERVWG